VKKRDNFIQRLFGIKKKKPKTNVPRTIFGF
jgi:hypothetical protein